MQKRTIAAALLLLAAAFTVSAHGPSRQQVVEEIAINAPADKVWTVIADFCSIAAWNPEITACEAPAGNALDTVRTVTLKNGEQLQEKLVGHEAETMTLQVMLELPNPAAIPVNTLGSKLTVKTADDGGSVLEWKAAFYRSFPGPTPPPELSDEAAIAAVKKIVQAGLAGARELAEK